MYMYSEKQSLKKQNFPYLNNKNFTDSLFKGKVSVDNEFTVQKTADSEVVDRITTPKISINERKLNFSEIEKKISEEQAVCEARRCMRCYLDFADTEEKPANLHTKTSEHKGNRKASMK